MKHTLAPVAALIALASPVFAPLSAQEEAATAPSPNEIVDAAPDSEWVAITAEDLLVMTLAPDRDGKSREVVIQLMPAPFSQGWVENIRTLARAKWYDGISVNRVQDNYVVQWGDPGHDNPEGGNVETKPLPEGLRVMGEEDYTSPVEHMIIGTNPTIHLPFVSALNRGDDYAPATGMVQGWPVGVFLNRGQFSKRDLRADPQVEITRVWPVHCYGMVGVGRNYSPDTGSGAELYTVIGHAPRHLDRNIALAGRIISGMEHLSSLPRGSGVLGFYTEEEADKRTPIVSIRVASDLPETARPAFEYLSTETESFARYAEARTNRRDPFFIVPAGGADICNIPVPIRVVSNE